MSINFFALYGAMAVTLDALRESIERHNETFESLLNIIPARFYISKEPDEAEVCAIELRHRLGSSKLHSRFDLACARPRFLQNI